MNDLIICVQQNEGADRSENPHIPFTDEEIARDAARCRDAGASIVHAHPRAADGSVDVSPEAMVRMVSAVHAASDILVAPRAGEPAGAPAPGPGGGGGGRGTQGGGGRAA
ncbi:MAG: 3-keto-5-aminohexanoate cleavage protein, partial [Microbacterium gubbeenense]